MQVVLSIKAGKTLSLTPRRKLGSYRIGDKAYDSDPPEEQSKKLDIELFAPHKANQKKAKIQDGRKLCRYKRHWKF